MEEKKSSFTTKAKEFWQGLSRTLRVLIVAVLAVLLVVIVYLVAVSGRVEYEVLQSGLSSAQAAEATTILGDLGIPYEVEGVSSVTIRVPKGTRSEVLLQMQSEGYPASDADLYNIYIENAGGMGATDQDKVDFQKISDAVSNMVHMSLQAFGDKDMELANEVLKYDDVVDNLFCDIRSDLVGRLKAGSNEAEYLMDMMMIDKYFERIGDHAVNIAKWVNFSITGEIEIVE